MGALDRHSAAAFGLAPWRQVTLVVRLIKRKIVASITLTPYLIRIRKKNKKEYCQLNNLPGKLKFIEILVSYLNDRKNEKWLNSQYQSALKIENYFHIENKDVIDGIIKAGKYGYAAELENIETGERFYRSVDDCEYLPFYFLIHHKEDQNECILMLQRFGIFGVKSFFFKDLYEYLKILNDELLLEINSIVPQSQLHQILGGSIKKIRYIKFSIPDDIADDLDLSDHNEEEAQLEMVVKLKNNIYPDWIRRILNGQADYANFIEIIGIEFDRIKLEVKLGNKYKTIDLSDLAKIRANFDITNNVEFNDDGHPTLESIRSEALDLLPEIRESIFWDND